MDAFTKIIGNGEEINNMQGVTVLNITECGGISGGNITGTVFFGAAALILIFIGIYTIYYGDFAGVFVVLLSIIPIFLCVAFATNINQPKYNKYQVIIDESVKMVEFNEKYEIVDQDGKIYTVIERGAQEND